MRIEERNSKCGHYLIGLLTQQDIVDLFFDFTEDAYTEIGAFFKRTGKMIKAFTVRDILDEAKLGMKLA